MSKQIFTFNTKLALVSLLTLLLWATTTNAEIGRWEDRLIAANLAYESGRYSEAEMHLAVALEQAEQVGKLDPRLAESHANLAMIYVGQSDFEKAEALLKRGLVILKSAPGTVQGDITGYIKTLATFYQAKAVHLKELAAVDGD